MDKLQEKIGVFFSWMILAMAFLTFAIVILRYAFNTGWVWLQELLIYLHAIIFLMTMAFALLKNNHVRVDIFYSKMTPIKKAWVNLLGVGFLLIPTCAVVIYQSWPYVVNSWAVFESSVDAEGLAYVYILKTFILISMILLALQGVSLSLKSLKVIRGA